MGIINRIPRNYFISGGASYTYTETLASFTIGTANAWTDYDIFTNNSVPKGAIVEIEACSIANATYSIGVRTDGSSIDRRNTGSARGAADGSATANRFFAKVHATTGLIECYAGHTTNVSFRIVGYFEDVDFTEAWDLLTGSDATWNEQNLFSSYSVPKGSVCAFALFDNSSSNYDIGVRTKGSSLTRYFDVCDSGGTSTWQPVCMIAKTDSTDGSIELYEENNANCDSYFQGYFSSAMDYQELNQSLTVSSTGWNSIDLTSYLDQDGRITDIIVSNTNTSAANTIGARKTGTATARYIDINISRTAGSGGNCMILSCNSDTSGSVDIYAEDNTNMTAKLLGYFK